MDFPLLPQIPITPLASPLATACKVRLSLWRLDQTHTGISGNKWFKLLPLRQSLREHPRPLLSFGGAFSNHLHALACAGHHWGVPTIGVVRGEPAAAMNPTLQDCRNWGMQLEFVSREVYRHKENPEWLASLSARHGDPLIVAEGGSSAAAVRSCGEIWSTHPQAKQHDVLFCALGTGATAAGLIAAKPSHLRVVVVPALNVSADTARQMVSSQLQVAGLTDPGGWHVCTVALRYGALSRELGALHQQAQTRWGITFDTLYTLRMLQACQRQLLGGQIEPGTRVLLLHSGGVQGVRGHAAKIRQSAHAFNGPMPL